MNRLTATGVPVQFNRNIATVRQEHSSGGKVHVPFYSNGNFFKKMDDTSFIYPLVFPLFLNMDN